MIKTTNIYNKMRVNKARNVFSIHVSSSLEFYQMKIISRNLLLLHGSLNRYLSGSHL